VTPLLEISGLTIAFPTSAGRFTAVDAASLRIARVAFDYAVEIVSDKPASTYERIFARHGDGAARAMMVGNSLKSDILPALASGAWAVHVPHELTWALEHAEEPAGEGRYRKLVDLGGLDDLVRDIG